MPSLDINGYTEEAKLLFKIAGPMILCKFLQVFGLYQSVLFCGHLGKDELDAMGAVGLVITFGLACSIGLSTASETLMSQAYGSPSKLQVGVVFQRSLWVTGIMFILSAAVCLNLEWIYRYSVPTMTISKLATIYSKVMIFGIAALYFNVQLQNILLCQSITWPFVPMYLLANVLIAGFHGLFLFVFKMGMMGSAIAVSLSMWITNIACIMYILWRGLHKNVWGGWTKASLLDWSSYAKLGVPGIVMVFFELAAFQAATLATGKLGEEILGAQTILTNLMALAFMFPYGLATGVTIRIGVSLGAQNETGARKDYILSTACAACYGLIMALLLGPLHNFVPRIFTSEAEVVQTASDAIPVFTVFFFFGTLHISLGGALRGCGRQLFGSICVILTHGVIGLTLALCLLFKSTLKLVGLWLGFTVSAALLTVIFLFYFWKIDWTLEMKEAIKRIEHEQAVESESSNILESDSDSVVSEVPVSVKWFLRHRLPSILMSLLVFAIALLLSIMCVPTYPNSMIESPCNISMNASDFSGGPSYN